MTEPTNYHDNNTTLPLKFDCFHYESIPSRSSELTRMQLIGYNASINLDLLMFYHTICQIACWWLVVRQWQATKHLVVAQNRFDCGRHNTGIEPASSISKADTHV